MKVHKLKTDPSLFQYTGRELNVRVTYTLHGGFYGLHENWEIMSVVPIDVSDPDWTDTVKPNATN